MSTVRTSTEPEVAVTRMSVRIEDFEDGALPRLCASSGESADRLYAMTAAYKPSWPVVFVVLGPVGWIVMLVVAAGSDRRVTGYVPFADVAQQQMRSRRWANWRHALEAFGASALAGVLLGVAHLGVAAVGVALVGLLATSGFWAAGARPRGSIGVKLARNGRSVEFSDVSPAFARRYHDQESQRLAARQALADLSAPT